MENEDKHEVMAEAEPKAEVQPAAPASKADAIRASKLPEEKKLEYLRQIGAVEAPKAAVEEQMSFDVYASVAGINPDHKQAMLVYPKARGVKSATLAEWKEIFKDF